MGAEGVVERVEGKDYKSAYEAHRDQVAWEEGHGGYTGSIAESTGVYLNSRPLLDWDAHEEAQRAIWGGRPNDPQKWGPTAAYPIAEPTKTRTKTITYDVAGLDWDKRREKQTQIIRANARPGEGVVKVDSKATERVPKVKTSTTTGEGKRVTVYVVLDEWGHVYKFRGGVESFDTQAKARAAAERAAQHARENPRGARGSVFTVEGRIRREDGSPLVTVKNETVKDPVTIVVTYGVPSTKPPKAWYLAGIYSS